MAIGRKPMPMHIRLVTGNPGKRKMPHQELSKPRRLRPPSFFTKEQKKIWAHCIKFAPYGLLQHIDTALMVQYVVARSLFEDACKNLENGSKLIKTHNNMVIPNPWYHIRNKQSAIMLSLASELGFTPSGRARLGVRDSHEKPDGDSVASKYFDD